MNPRMIHLIKGELTRLNKYHVTTVSFIVTVLWFLLLYFIDDADVLSQMLPFILVIDATMMSIIFIGAIMFFEKTESTFSTMLVTPVTNRELILSKTISNTIHSFVSTLLIVIVFYFVKQIEVSWVFLVIALIIPIIFHSLLGFAFSFHTKDFTSMLVGVMIYNILLTVPPVLNFFYIIFKGEVWEYVLLILPVQASIKLIEVAFGAPVEAKFFISLFFLTAGIFFGYRYYILPKFKAYAVKQSGV